MPGEPAYVAHMTAEELLLTHLPDKSTELIRGRLVVREPPGARHGSVTMNLALRLANHVDLTGAGQVFAAETGFTLSRAPDTVRAPDIAFVRRERLPRPIPDGYAELAPDLVVEVLSPRDRPGEVLAKVADWLEAGTALVWVIDPERRVARVYRADGREDSIDETESLNGEDVLPGFGCPLIGIL